MAPSDHTERGGAAGEAPARPRILFPALVLLGAALLLLAAFGYGRLTRGGADAAAGGVGGPFALVDQNGRPATEAVLKGRWSLLFFGYTYCPDTCPATLQDIGAAARRLGPDARGLQVVFVSVDPERDTPAQLKSYLEAQGLPIPAVGLTGTTAAVARAAKAYGVYYARSGSGADYTVDHSAAIYLMGPDGRFRRPLAHDMAPKLMADQIREAERG